MKYEGGGWKQEEVIRNRQKTYITSLIKTTDIYVKDGCLRQMINGTTVHL